MAIVRTTLTLFIFVYVCQGEEINIAEDKPVNMSSRYNNNKYPPENAVDGITSANINNIIHTSSETTTPAWWWVDLETKVQDATVTIYFRTDSGKLRRNGIQIYTSTTFSTNPVGQLCHNFTGSNIPNIDSVNCTGTWRYLLVYKTSTTNTNDQGPVLDFGEVEVLVCSNGMYGQSCTKDCSSRQCIMPSSSCDRYTGTCLGGCKAGWMGTDCTQGCPNHLYGANCRKSCSSRNCVVNSTTCDVNTGVCSGACKPGWSGTDCTEVCPSGTYGVRCSESCDSHQCAVTSTSCNHITGACPGGCRPGWMGTRCTQVCYNGTYGLNCKGSCESHQCAVTSTPCDPITGACPAGECKPGWMQANCTKACVDTYGPECSKSCDNRQCVNSSSCHHVTGTCEDGCKPGWSGVDCTLEYTGNTQDSQSLAPAVAGTLSGIIVIAVIVIVIVVYRRKRNSPSSVKYGQNGKTSLESPNVGSMNAKIDPLEKNENKEKRQPTKAQIPLAVVADTEQEEQDEEILVTDEPSPNRDYYNENEDVIREISVTDLAATVRKLKQRGGFEAGYHRLPNGFLSSYGDSQKPENAGKNKFRGYYPYDHNRVRLTPIPDIPGSDYFNASLMHSYDKKKTYIASQAPNNKTFGDFWRMIWEQRCERVIMLTGLVEDMKVKCYQYWPKNGMLETDHFKVEVEDTDVRANYTIRHLKVTCKKNKECRSVVQYHFTSWPDHGVPDTLALVHFIWMIRRTGTLTDGPLLVHCSAGIGRTGTYIAVDSLIDQARETAKVDVLGFVSAMREERKNMIQTKEQYECVFQCLVEMTTFGNTSMDVENFFSSYSSRGMNSMVDRKTIRELIQILTTEDRKDSPDQHRMWVDGNQDFIVRVGPTPRYLRGYLQAVAPAPGMERLLWKLVEENNVRNVIIVSPLQKNIIGEKGTTKIYGDVTVTTTDQNSPTSDLSVETLQLRHANEGMSRSVQLFRFSRTITMDSLTSHLLDHTHLQHLSNEMTPVVLIHSIADRKITAWFCIMANILSGILEDHCVDVIGHVRTFLKCCPELTITEQEVERFHKFAKKCVEMTSSANTYANLKQVVASDTCPLKPNNDSILHSHPVQHQYQKNITP